MTKHLGRIIQYSLKATTLALVATVLASVAVSSPALADAKYGNFWVYGRIELEYKAQGGPAALGNPIIAESNAALPGTKFQKFEKSSSIYWNSAVAGGYAKMVRGAIRDKWAEYDYERGPFGYPTISEATLTNNGKYSTFQGGSIYYSPATGAHQVWGNLRDQWANQGYENGALGYPVTDEYELRGGFQQVFQGGVLSYNVAPEGDADPTNTNAVIGGDDPYNSYQFNRFAGYADAPAATCAPEVPDQVTLCLAFGDAEMPPLVPVDTAARQAPSSPSAPTEPTTTTPAAPTTTTPAPTTTTPAAPTTTSGSDAPRATTAPATFAPQEQPQMRVATGSNTPPNIVTVDDPTDEPGGPVEPEPDDPIFPDRITAEEDAFFVGNTFCKNEDIKQIQGKRFVACNVQQVTVRAARNHKAVGWQQGFLYSEVSTPAKADGTFEQQPLVRVQLNMVKTTGTVPPGVTATVRMFTHGGLDAAVVEEPTAAEKTQSSTSKPRWRFKIQDRGINTGAGLNKISTFRPKLGITFNAPGWSPLPEAAYAFAPVRCDSMAYVPHGPGCVIDPYFANLPREDLRTTQALPTPVVANDLNAHILNSQNSGRRGNPGILSKLTRIVSESDKGKNYAASCGNRYKTRKYKPAPTLDWQCDEYPYASSYEGAASNPTGGKTFNFCKFEYQQDGVRNPYLPLIYPPNPNPPFFDYFGWTACLIPTNQNGAGGLIHKAVMNDNRVLDKKDDEDDGFYVAAYHP